MVLNFKVRTATESRGKITSFTMSDPNGKEVVRNKDDENS